MNMEDLNHIYNDELDELLSMTSRIKDPLIYEEKKKMYIHLNDDGSFSFTDLMNFLTSDLSFIRSLLSFQRRLCEVTLGYERWKSIKLRKKEMIKIWKYRDNNRGENPSEPFCKYICRIINGKPNPYKFDYEVVPANINNNMFEILDNFKVRYHPIQISNRIKNPRIMALRKVGSVYSREKMNDPFSDLSHVSSGSDTSYFLPDKIKTFSSSEDQIKDDGHIKKLQTAALPITKRGREIVLPGELVNV